MFKSSIKLLCPVICLVQILSGGCISDNISCPDIPAYLCRNIIASHEFYPGELLKSGSHIKVEIHNDKKGLWLGSDTFRILVEHYNSGIKTGTEKITYTGCSSLTDADTENVKNTAFLIFKEIYFNELYRKDEMINYP